MYNSDEYHARIRPRPLRQVTDIETKPRTWNRDAGIISFEYQPAAQIVGGGKDHHPTYLRPTKWLA